MSFIYLRLFVNLVLKFLNKLTKTILVNSVNVNRRLIINVRDNLILLAGMMAFLSWLKNISVLLSLHFYNLLAQWTADMGCSFYLLKILLHSVIFLKKFLKCLIINRLFILKVFETFFDDLKVFVDYWLINNTFYLNLEGLLSENRLKSVNHILNLLLLKTLLIM